MLILANGFSTRDLAKEKAAERVSAARSYLKSTLSTQDFGKESRTTLLRRSIDGLRPQATPLDTETAVYTIVNYEIEKKADKENLDRLAKSKSPTLQKVGRVYDQTKLLTDAEANEISTEFAKGTIDLRLANAHLQERLGKPRPVIIDPASAKRFQTSFRVTLFTFSMGVLCLILVFAVRPAMSGLAIGQLNWKEAERSVVLFLVYIVGYLLLGAVLYSLTKPTGGEEVKPLSLLFFFITLAGLLFGVTKLKIGDKPITLRQFGLRTDSIWKDLNAAIVGVLISRPVLVIGFWLGRVLFPNLSSRPQGALTSAESGNALQIGLILVATCIFAPIIEEIGFRGTLLPALRKATGGIVPALTLTSLIFGGIHSVGLPGVPGLVGIGLIAGIISYGRGNLIAPILFHSLYNLLTLVTVLLAS